MNFQEWYDQTIGKPIDIDGAFGDQCVDIAMSWAQFCFPGHQWPELLGYGDAKDLYDKANSEFFDKNTNQPPHQGDLVIFGPTATNPYGHIAVVVSADSTQMQVIEQNGFNPSGVAYTAQRPYNNVTGFLHPKGMEDMKVDDALARRLLTLGMFLAVEGTSDPDRQPTLDEINNAIGRDAVEYIDYLTSTDPWKNNWLHVKYYTKDVADAKQQDTPPAPAPKPVPTPPPAPQPAPVPVNPPAQHDGILVRLLRLLGFTK